MDSLLEDLASLLVGSVNPRLNTSTMARVRDARSGQEVSLALTQDQMQELERADRARRIFAELSRFYRGAVQLAYAGANWKINYNLKNSQTWYDGLTKWSFLCGAETCIEKLDVRTLVDGGDPEERDLDALDPDKMDEPRTKAKGKQKNKSGEHEHDVISRSKFMVAISVHDGRFGFPAQRSVSLTSHLYSINRLLMNLQSRHLRQPKVGVPLLVRLHRRDSLAPSLRTVFPLLRSFVSQFLHAIAWQDGNSAYDRGSS